MTAQLIRLLADGEIHSGEQLGEQLNITRAGVWKQIKTLTASGIDIETIGGRGYRLKNAFELLDSQQIQCQLNNHAAHRITEIETHFELESTNRYLLNQVQEGQPFRICLAERQTQGRGRRGRQWISPLNGNIYLSIHWCFDPAPATLPALSLAIGVALARVTTELGVSNVQLKWPNDLLHQGRKLAGILIEMAGEAQGPCHLVIGVGYNLNSHQQLAEVDQAVTALSELSQTLPNRNAIAAMLINALSEALITFESEGFAPFIESWNQYDFLHNRPVRLSQADQHIHGVAKGVHTDGALILDRDGKLEYHRAGEASLRLADAC